MMCDNGVNGISSSNGEVCCVAACGQCGGAGCSIIARPTFDAFDCCVTEIMDFGNPCSETGTAPCFVDGAYCESFRDFMAFALPLLHQMPTKR